MRTNILKFLHIIILLTLISISALLIYAPFNETLQQNILLLLIESRSQNFIGIILAVLIFLSIIIPFVIKAVSYNEGFIDFDSGDGSVGISTKAMRDYIDRVACEFSAVKNVNTKIISNKKGLSFLLKVKIEAGNSIPELSQMMQKRVRASVRDSLGIEDVENISINIHEILNQDSSSTEKNIDPENIFD